MPSQGRDWITFKCFLLVVVCLELLNITDDAVISEATFGEGIRNKTPHEWKSATSSRWVPPVSSWSDILLKTANASIISLSLQNHSYWGKNEICDIFSDVNQTSTQSFGNFRRTLLNLTFSCDKLYHTSGLGTGNWISALYAIRLAAAVAGGKSIDLLASCTDAIENKHSLILPWLMGLWRPEDMLSQILDGTSSLLPSKEKVCGGYNDVPLAYMLPIMKYELRRMAIALIGVPNADHPSARFAEEFLWANVSCNGKSGFQSVMQVPNPEKDEAPLYENIFIDDAIVHFRCGDLMFSRHPSFGFMKFSGFSKWISPSARSIGIVTQPFEVSGQTRKEDSGASKRQKCKDLVLAFTDHLTTKFPSARISIHNGVNETIALSFARMIMANQTIVGISSFGVFPALASFGIGYIRKPDNQKQPNQWLLDPLFDAASNGIILMEEPNLLWVSQLEILRKIGGEPKVIEWFRNDTFCLGTEELKCKS